MVFLYTPGKALGCNVNAHRHGWNGSVCTDASSWSCSADQSFRDDYCSRGDDRCYHAHLFNAETPRFQIDDNGIGWMLHVDSRALDDQIMLIWGGDFGEPRGLRENRYGRGPLFGAYRIKTCRKIELPYRILWEVTPHADGWTRCHNLRIPRPTSRSLSGKYVREVDRNSLLSAFDEGQRIIEERRDLGWFHPEDADRFRNFKDNIEAWLEAASKAAEGRGHGQRDQPPFPSTVRVTTGPASQSPLANLANIVTPSDHTTATSKASQEQRAGEAGSKAEGGTNRAGAKSRPDAAPVAGGGELIEPAGRSYIAATYGADTLLALRIATLTKPLLILRGNTGVGKSHLALQLIDDSRDERTLVVPVAATWRGREDLLGYVNPISTEFEPTAFTKFLFSAWKAWQKGDQRPRLVVFEEFNLSQPEHWFSDILVLSQFEDLQRRRIDLGGKNVRGIVDSDEAVTLSPAIRFVATINNDHTTRPLSPRVIDRAAIVELDLEPSEAIRLAGADIANEQVLAITELDELLRNRGASFSLRTARSLNTSLKQAEAMGIGPWQAIDMVVVQEVLSKVRLLARDPNDAGLMKDLQRWSEKHGAALARCSRTIESWNELLDSGADVLQA